MILMDFISRNSIGILYPWISIYGVVTLEGFMIVIGGLEEFWTKISFSSEATLISSCNDTLYSIARRMTEI
jgi:hypothetical protein